MDRHVIECDLGFVSAPVTDMAAPSSPYCSYVSWGRLTRKDKSVGNVGKAMM